MKKSTVVFLFLVCFTSLAAHALAQTLTKNISISFNVEPVLTVKVTPLEGGSGIDFGTIDEINKDRVISRSLEISVISNTGAPYKITQRIDQPFTDESGNSLPEDIVKFHLAPSGDTKGRLEVASPSNLKSGEQIIFSSTPDGASDKFIIIYEFKSGSLIKAGNYLTSITFTASM